MKKVLAIISVSVFIFFAAGVPAFADCGPKESLTISVTGTEDGREYFLTLRSDFDPGYYDEYIEKISLEWRALYEISRTTDGYSLYTSPVDKVYYKMTGGGSRTWGYDPPNRFKILLYFPDDGSYILSEMLERYAFDSYFTVDVSDGEMSIAKNGGARGFYIEVGGLLVRMAITVLLELGVARLFGYSGSKEYRLIIIMNLCTQVFLNILIAVGDIGLGGLGAAAAYILAELIILVVEASVYAVALPRFTERKTGVGRAVGYAFAANTASFFIGGFLLIVGEAFFWTIIGS